MIIAEKDQQTPSEKVLWALDSSGWQLSISRLRSQTDLLKFELDAILEELKKKIGS